MDFGEKKCKGVKIRNEGSMQDRTMERVGSQQRGERLIFTKFAMHNSVRESKTRSRPPEASFITRVGPNSSRVLF